MGSGWSGIGGKEKLYVSRSLQREKGTNKKSRFSTIENALMVTRGWVKQVEVEEGTYDEHQVYGNVQLHYCTPEADITLFVNWNLNRN